MKSIFVSSTFKDMQKERDLLRNEVLPEINKVARLYGESIRFSDLRWGIDTTSLSEIESGETVLSACFDEIDRARPYMIVLLGEHYGFIPKQEIIQNEINKRKGFKLESTDISYTQLEIEYGALLNSKSVEHTFFYFRELEGDNLPDYFVEGREENKEKLNKLKERIRKVAGNRVFSYKAKWDGSEVTGLDGFVQQVKIDVLREFEEEWKRISQLNPIEKIEAIQENYINGLEENFDISHSSQGNIIKDKIAAIKVLTEHSVTRDFNYLKWRKRVKSNGLSDIIRCTRSNGSLSYKIANRIGTEPFVFHGEPYKPFMIVGEPGSGKTMAMLHTCKIVEKCGFKVIKVFCGSTSFLSSSQGVLLYIIWQIERIMKIPHYYMSESDNDIRDILNKLDVDEALDYLNSLITIFSKKRRINKGYRILIAVDAVDRLRKDEYRAHINFMPEQLNEYVKAVFTTNEVEDIDFFVGKREIPQLKEDDIYNLIDGALNVFGKQLAQSVKDCIFNKPNTGNALYYYLAVARLTMIDADGYKRIKEIGRGINAINTYMISMIEKFPLSTKELSCDLIFSCAHMVKDEACGEAAKYIAISRHGLRVSDLKALTEIDQLEFSHIRFVQFVNYMNELFFVRDNGAYDFLHDIIRTGLIEMISDETEKYEKKVMNYLLTLPWDDDIKQKELFYYVCKQGSGELIFSLLADIATLGMSIKEQVAVDLKEDIMGKSGNLLYGFMHSLIDSNVKDNILPRVILFLLKYVMGSFGDKTEEEEFANRYYDLISDISTAYYSRNPSRDALLLRIEVVRFIGKYNLNNGTIQSLNDSWQLFSWAHDRFRDMHISGDKHIEIIRGECDSLVNLYKITEQTDEKKYIDMKDRILNDLESLVLMYPNEYFEEKQVLKVKLLCFKGEQCLRKGGINNIEAAGQLLSEAYQIVTEGKYRHSIEYNMLRMRICMSLGDVIFKNRDRYSIKNSEKFYNEALQISLQIRNRNKSIETIEMAMNAYIRKADFLFEAADHTFSLFAYIKQEDAIDCIDYCGRLADTINRKKHSLKKEYLYNRILHKKVVVGRRHNSTNRTGRLGLEIGLELLEKEMEELRESGAMFPYYDRDYAECAYEIAYHKFCLEEYGFRESYDLCKIAYDISVKYIEKDNSIDNRMYKAKYASLLSELLANTVNVDYWKAALNYIIQAIDIYRDNMSIRQDFISKVYYGNALRQYLLICEDIGGKDMLLKAEKAAEKIVELRNELKMDYRSGKLQSELVFSGILLRRIRSKLRKC